MAYNRVCLGMDKQYGMTAWLNTRNKKLDQGTTEDDSNEKLPYFFSSDNSIVFVGIYKVAF